MAKKIEITDKIEPDNLFTSCPSYNDILSYAELACKRITERCEGVVIRPRSNYNNSTKMIKIRHVLKPDKS